MQVKLFDLQLDNGITTSSTISKDMDLTSNSFSLSVFTRGEAENTA
jgi:hypothetical protein